MKFTSILIAFILLGFCSEAQTVSDTSIDKYALSKNTVVTNEKGKAYPYSTWSKLVASKSYGLKPVDAESDSTTFVLYKYNETEENKAFAKLPRPEESGCFKDGDKFKFFDLTDINGKSIKAADMAGKIVVINFWFIACPICRYEMPELNRLVDTYKNNKDVVFIALGLESKKKIEQFLKISPFKYQLVENMMASFIFYGIKECPVSVVVDRDGIIKFQCVGYGEGAAPYWIKKTIEEIK